LGAMTSSLADSGGSAQPLRRTGLLLLELALEPWGPRQAELLRCLPAQAQARIQRYRRDDDRNRGLAAAFLPRLLIAQQTGQSPAAIELQRSPRGKPYYPLDPSLQFNLSHSGIYVALAVGPDPVGVDVEQLRLSTDIDGIARRFFAADEQRWLAQFRTSERAARFFELWSRKESLLKATGDGLAGSLAAFSVIPDAGGQLSLAFRGRHWQLRSYQDLAGYSLALCTCSTPPSRPLLCQSGTGELIEGTAAAVAALAQVAVGPAAP